VDTPFLAKQFAPPVMRSALSLDKYLKQTDFHHINHGFPNLKLVNEEPFVFVVPEFITEAECNTLIKMKTDSARQTSATAPEQVQKRTSSSIYPAAHDVSWLRERIADLVDVSSDSQLEPTKISEYDMGEHFTKHTDASFIEATDPKPT